MTAVETLLRRKWRLTDRLRRADLRRMKAEKPERPKTLLRARLHRIDLLLERAGYFG